MQLQLLSTLFFFERQIKEKQLLKYIICNAVANFTKKKSRFLYSHISHIDLPYFCRELGRLSLKILEMRKKFA